MDNATIFYNDRKWLAGEPCFDVRFEGQCLPAGSVVIGFVTETSELLDPPYMEEMQMASYQEAGASARAEVRGPVSVGA